MRSLLLARGRALIVCAFAALAGGLAGCTTKATTPSVTGGTLKIYVSAPGGTLSAEAQDVLAAERLAFSQGDSQVGKFKLELVQCGGGHPCGGPNLSDNARQAIGDSSTIAYLGELPPGGSAGTLGITNAQDVLQVSPTDTALELTQSTPAVSGSPTKYYESLGTYGRTFARVVPTNALEAAALVTQMLALGVTHLYIATDGSTYGDALAYAVRSAVSGKATVVSAISSADGVLYAGTSPSLGAATLNQAASGNGSVKLFASSALASDGFAGTLSPAAQRDAYISSPGFGTSDLPAQAQQFVSSFRATYGHAPSARAIFGYEAMAAVLQVLHGAGSGASNRSTVVKDFFAIRNRSSVLGTYSIDHNGDISFSGGAPFVFNRIKAGKLVPYKAVQEQG